MLVPSSSALAQVDLPEPGCRVSINCAMGLQAADPDTNMRQLWGVEDVLILCILTMQVVENDEKEEGEDDHED